MFSWTQDNIDILKDMWAQNKTATQVAAVLGITKNAVIGKVDRLKLPMRASLQERLEQVRIERKRAIAPRIAPVKWKPAPKPVEKATDCSRMLPLTALRAGMCHWPVGDPHDDDFRFCAADAELERSYCPHHHALAHRPRPEKKPEQAPKKTVGLWRQLFPEAA